MNKPQQYTAAVPKDVEGLRKQLISMIQSGLTSGATPYYGPIAPMTNPMTLNAANMISQMMGYGQYQSPGFIMNPYTGLSTARKEARSRYGQYQSPGFIMNPYTSMTSSMQAGGFANQNSLLQLLQLLARR